MEIRIDPHTLERAEERGANAEEIKDVIMNGFPISAKRGRHGSARVYDFNRSRHDKMYEQKRVEVIYTMEHDVAVTITVYVFYGKWESQDANPV